MLDTLARRDHADVVGAAAVLRDGASTGEDDTAWVLQSMARYQVPREIVVTGGLPRDATGKVLEEDLVGSSGGTGESDRAR